MDRLFATKSEGVGLIVCARFPTYVITIHQRYSQMDRRTTCVPKNALCTKVHCAVKSEGYKTGKVDGIEEMLSIVLDVS